MTYDNSKHLEKLTPYLRTLAEKLLKACAEKTIRVRITQSLRTKAEQAALYAQGREDLEEVNELRREVGWDAITKGENGHRVTWTLNSRHLPGPDGLARAFDIGVFDTFGDYIKTAKGYEEVAKLGRALGLECGYYWPKQDPGHFQLDPIK